MRIYAAKKRYVKDSVTKILAEEEAAGITRDDAFISFGKRAAAHRDALAELLHEHKKAGKRVVGYGATAKSATLLNYGRIGPDLLEYITDTTPLKQGLFTPGTHIPIVNPDRLRTERPDTILLLAWNFKAAILEKERTLRDGGVQFIIPFPELRVV